MEMNEASNGFQLSLACSLFIFGRFRVQDIASILHVGCTFLKKLIKLYTETSNVNYPAERAAVWQNKALGWYVYTTVNPCE